ncbi:MAG: DUF6591 domain-containing protein [Acutalibacteraceae bacterium]|nr:DUF6591 domain-containing protein [Acutalibacteraceae bacterium]
MKKLVIALLIAVMVPACVACGPSESADTDKDTTSSVSSVEKEDTKDDAEDEAEEATEDKAEDEAEEKTEDKTETKTDDTTSTVSTDGVDPELVKAMDEYSAFIDDFMVFMTPYKDLDTETADEAVVSEFFTEYMAFVAKYESKLAAFSEINPETLEGKDKEYFEAVNSALEQKLRDAGFDDEAGI